MDIRRIRGRVELEWRQRDRETRSERERKTKTEGRNVLLGRGAEFRSVKLRVGRRGGDDIMKSMSSNQPRIIVYPATVQM